MAKLGVSLTSTWKLSVIQRKQLHLHQGVDEGRRHCNVQWRGLISVLEVSPFDPYTLLDDVDNLQTDAPILVLACCKSDSMSQRVESS